MPDTANFSKTFRAYFENASSGLSATEKKLLPVMSRDGSMPEYVNEEAVNWIVSLLTARSERKLSDVYRVSLSGLVNVCVSEELKEEFFYALDQMNQFQMTAGWYRRSVRGKSYTPFVRASVLLLWAYARLRFYGAEFFEVLTGNVEQDIYQNARRSDWHYAGILASQIDGGNEKTIQAVRDILLGENNTVMISHELIRGIVMCKNEDMYRLLGDFLLAARLQEGARQAVCETMDAGRPEAFLYLLKVIEDNDLIRYSSVRRAVSTWIGIYDPDSVERLSGKLLHLMGRCLREPEFCEQQLVSEDAAAICCALWAKGFYDAGEGTAAVLSMIENGTKHQIMAASYFLGSLQSRRLQMDAAKKVIFTYPEALELAACYLPYFMGDVWKQFEELVDYRDSGCNRYYYSPVYDKGIAPKQITAVKLFHDEEEAKKAYGILKGILKNIPKKGLDLNPCIFPWYRVTMKQSDVAVRLCLIAWMLQENTYLNEAAGMIPSITAESRHLIARVLLYRPKTAVQKDFLLDYLHGQGERTMDVCFQFVKRGPLEPEDYLKIEQNMKYKKGRAKTLELLKLQPPEALKGCIKRLLNSRQEETHMGALELAQYLKEKRPEQYEPLVPALRSFQNPSSKEQILLTELLGAEEEEEDILKKPGYGLYDPKTELVIPPVNVDLTQSETLFSFGEDACIRVLERLDALIEENKDREYEDCRGEEQLLGNRLEKCRYAISDIMDAYPFRELWEEFYEKEIQEPELLLEVYLYQSCLYEQREYEKNTEYYREVFGRPPQKEPPFRKLIQGHRYSSQMKTVIENLFYQYVPKELKARWGLFGIAKLLYVLEPLVQEHMAEFKDKPWRNEKQILSVVYAPVFKQMHQWLSEVDGEDWENGFALRYRFGTGVPDYIQCYLRGIWDKNMAYKAILEQCDLETLLYVTSVAAGLDKVPARGMHFGKIYAFFGIDRIPKVNGQCRFDLFGDSPDMKLARELYHDLVPLILHVELKRGEQMTPFSKAVGQIQAVFGVEILVRILTALGKDVLERNRYFWCNGEDKRMVFCHLLKVCYPRKGENIDSLRRALKGTAITKKRLIETAMYARQWIPFMEEYLEMPGFMSGCYYFMAHTSEWIDDTSMAVVARYTPLSREELCGGAFDVHWFFETYEKLGEKNFKLLYDAAKYSSSTAAHARARKYADASLGKVTFEQLTAEVDKKRNKDLLMSLPLLPLAEDREEREAQLLERYQFIQKFKKESSRFGAQRRSSEAHAAELALQNLSTNAGFTDKMRLILRMESRLTEEYEACFSWTLAGDVEIRIFIDEAGRSSLQCRKDGKALKSIPSKYKKEEMVNSLKEADKKLKEQYRRTRQMLEQAMEDRTAFEMWELEKLRENPVIRPMIEPLVFREADEAKPLDAAEGLNRPGETRMGFLSETGLTDCFGKEIHLSSDARVWIAYPCDFYETGCWHEYQKALFERKLRQPFKQIFRELYVKLPEELDKESSFLFSGNQIQPKKTVAALRSRRWTADYENGLQKVYYKENIIAKIYALADWFSPSDIEAPTLEIVAFYDRKTFRPLKIREIPDIIYSEVMRDVDLAVSVAHAGGVDPETSHSTVEMRRVIMENNLRLFGVQNVRLEGSHAFVDGKLGQYTVHLGSGVVHQAGNAMIHVVPVHSQHRGRIFLPFVDEDPKTAEILSKILLFAEDTKIKDPGIISQIR